MPVSTDQLAADIRDSNHRLAEAFNELSRRIEATEGESNRRLTDAVQDFGRRFEVGEAKLTEFRLEIVDKLSSINTNLQVIQTRTDISISIARWAIGIAVPLLLALIGFSFSMSWHAAKLDSLVKQHDDSIRADRVRDEAIAKNLDLLVKKLTP